jgi:hypothetical protein
LRVRDRSRSEIRERTNYPNEARQDVHADNFLSFLGDVILSTGISGRRLPKS